MTEERRAHLLRQIVTITSLAEMDGFRQGLCAQGEMQDPEVFAAVWARIEVLERQVRR